jgi:hypothetical protein
MGMNGNTDETDVQQYRIVPATLKVELVIAVMLWATD